MKATEYSRYIYQSELDKACFQHDMTYGDFQDLPRITASDQVIRDKTFNVPKNPKYDGYQCRLSLLVYKFFDKNFNLLQINLLQVVLLKVKLCQTKNWLKTYTNQILENLKNGHHTNPLKIIFAVLIWQIHN